MFVLKFFIYSRGSFLFSVKYVNVFVYVFQAQVQIARDNAVTSQQRSASGRRIRKEGYGGTEVDRTGNNPFSEQDSGILDVDDEQEDEVREGREAISSSFEFFVKLYLVFFWLT